MCNFYVMRLWVVGLYSVEDFVVLCKEIQKI